MRSLPAGALALLVAWAAAGRGPATAGDATPWADRVAALAKDEPNGLALSLPPASGGEPVPVVRVERRSEIATFLAHLSRADPSHVLLSPEPAPEVARATVLSEAEPRLVVSVTGHGFRIADGPGQALAFRSTGLLRWMKDHLSAPDRRLLPGNVAKDVDSAIEAFAKATASWAAPEPVATGNLLKNGDFEEELTGKQSPVGWDRMDGVTTFWVKDAVDPKGHGHVVLLDTDVYESEWKKRQAEMKADPDSKPWPKTPVPEADQYATVGGNHGVSVYSEAMPVQAGRPYRLTLAFRTDLPSGTAKVWVRGYGDLDTPKGPEERHLYDALVTLRMGSPGWKTHSMVFHPTKNKPAVTKMRVMLYGYWPRGSYAFDDLVLVPISDDEYAHAKDTERSDVK